MLNIQLANKYARAIFELAIEDNNLDQFYQDLAFVRDNIFNIPDAVAFFNNPIVPHHAKKDLLFKALNGSISDTVLHFLFLLSDKNRIGIFCDIFNIFFNLKNDAQGILIADVTSAFPLSNLQLNNLATKLAAVSNKKILIRSHLDPAILGGCIVRIGDKLIDGSAAGRLKALRSSLSS